MALDNFNPYLFVSAGEQSNKYLTPVISPDGIASFQAQRAQDLSGLIVRIDPVQSGSGDPSPTNIRPISGRTGLTVVRAGKNLLEGLEVGNIDQTTGQDITGTAVRSVGYVGVLPNQTYTVSGLLISGGVIRLFTYAKDKTYIGTQTINFSGYVAQFSVDAYYVRFQSSDAIFKATTPVQVEVGSTATPYTPYVAPTTYSVTWQTEAGTVYGGTLDVVSGVLTVTHALYTITQFIGSQEGNGFRTNIVLPNAAPIAYPTLYCNMFRSAESYAQAIGNAVVPNSIGANVSGLLLLNAYADGAQITTYDALNALLPEDGCKIVYPLATPQTYQLTPTEVRTIAGYNQVYSDAGPVIDIKF